MDEFGLRQRFVGIPLLVGAQVSPVVFGAELSREKPIRSVWKHHGTLPIPTIQHLHVIPTVGLIDVDLTKEGGLDDFSKIGVITEGRFDNGHERGEGVYFGEEPVRTRHGNGGLREEEQLIQVLQECHVGIKMDHPIILKQTEGIQFDSTRVPFRLGRSCL